MPPMPISRSTISPRIMCWRSMWPCEGIGEKRPLDIGLPQPGIVQRGIHPPCATSVFMSGIEHPSRTASSSADHIDIVHRVLPGGRAASFCGYSSSAPAARASTLPGMLAEAGHAERGAGMLTG